MSWFHAPAREWNHHTSTFMLPEQFSFNLDTVSRVRFLHTATLGFSADLHLDTVPWGKRQVLYRVGGHHAERLAQKIGYPIHELVKELH